MAAKRNRPIFLSFEPFKRLHEPRRAALSINGESVVMPPSAVPPAPLEHKKETDGGGVGGDTALVGGRAFRLQRETRVMEMEGIRM